MSKPLRGALLITLTYAFTQCGAASGEVTQDPGVSSAGQSGSAAHAGDAGAKTDGSGGSVAAGAGGAFAVGGAAGVAGVAGMAGAAGAAGGAGGLGCGATCGPNAYCRAPCSGIGFGFGGTTGVPVPPSLPSCAPLPAACNGTPTCDCICGLGSTQWCSTGSKPITSGPAVQCGCG